MSTEYYEISFNDKVDINQPEGSIKRILPFQDSELIEGSIIKPELLTQRVDPSVPHVYKITICLPEVSTFILYLSAFKTYEKCIKGCSRIYKAGDTIGILPKNDEKEICEIFNHLNLNDKVDLIAQIKGSKIPAHVPANGNTLKEIFTNNLDLHSVPTKLFLKALAAQTDDSTEIERLNEICKAGNSDKYSEFVNAEGKNLLSIFKAFPRCQPTLSTLIKFLPSLKPRPYSVSSAFCGKELSITFSVRHEKEKGVCSGYLEQFCDEHANDLSLEFYFRKVNDFRLPQSQNQCVIMIATGAGLAPFMGFLEERATADSNAGMYLYYGCRYQQQDFIYKDQLEQYRKDKVLTELHTTFSRDSPEKRYIQERIKETWQKLYQLITNEDALVYVCGDAKTMMIDVKRTIIELLMKYNSYSEEEAKNFIESMVKCKRYVEEKWV